MPPHPSSGASMLPDDLWLTALRLGVAKNLGYRDLCCVALVCRRLRRLGSSDSLWESAWNKYWSDSGKSKSNPAARNTSEPSSLTCVLASEGDLVGAGSIEDGRPGISAGRVKRKAPDSAPEIGADRKPAVRDGGGGYGGDLLATSAAGAGRSDIRVSWSSGSDRAVDTGMSWKRRFQERFERERQRLVQAHRREVMRQQSHVAELERRIREGQEERERTQVAMAAAVEERKTLERMIAAGKAPENVWEPQHLVQQRQQLVAQTPLSAPARLAAVRQEAALLRCTLSGLDTSAVKHQWQLTEAQRVLQGLLFKPEPRQPHCTLQHQPSTPAPSCSRPSRKKPKL